MGTDVVIAFSIDFALIAVAADIAAGADADEISRNEDVNHLWGARGRAILLLLPSVVFGCTALTVFTVDAILRALLQTVLSWVAFGAIFWAVFDLRLNQRRGKPWYYLGSGAESATIDGAGTSFFSAFNDPRKMLFVVKMAVLLVSFAVWFAVFRWHP